MVSTNSSSYEDVDKILATFSLRSSKIPYQPTLVAVEKQEKTRDDAIPIMID